ncbi:hypothetical protein KEU06_14410 [Pseudaminobacter sp. 19-2017]|uniref:Tripartite tricarboxylate transporter TctB family protein n=1 Tax=Pseudaminobacter soli (ex Zhang et al. 2022) TaxID=2831468 RepID=A0A942I2J8_9HYPH|nr:hypothetical protein [Pseudaminobacter soli]MBS3649802.1 hypothetical protein [Pseudaminobacter soli]
MAILPTGCPDSHRKPAERTLPLGALTAFVVFSIVGSGVFILSQNMDIDAWWLPIVVGWVGTAAGILALVLVYQPRAVRRGECTREHAPDQGGSRQSATWKGLWRIVLILAATAYGCLAIYAVGPGFLLMCAVLSVPGILFFIWARRETGQHAIGPLEALLTATIVVICLLATFHMWTGVVSPP